MRMLSGKHWLTVGLALLVSAQGFGTKTASAQSPMGADAPTSMAFPGPAPVGCDTYCDDGQGLFGNKLLRGPFGSRLGNGNYCSDYGAYGSGAGGCGMDMGSAGCGPVGCGMGGCGDGGLLSGGRLLGGGRLGGGLLGGCRDGSCAAGLVGLIPGLNGGCSLLSGNALRRILGPFAPYSDGNGSQRWFDVYAGTTVFSRSSKWGGIGSTQQVFETGEFLTTDVISSVGIGTPAVPPPDATTPGQVAQPGTPALRVSSLDMDKFRAGLELIGNIQFGPGSNVEVRYFGLNKWSDSREVRNTAANLYSVFSQWGTNPPGGFDDTDRSLIHRISYTSKFDNGEVNYRRRWLGVNPAFQGSWLGGIRYFELGERFGFAATGSRDNTFTFDQLRFFNMDTRAQNHLVGFQLGADLWTTIVPGFSVGNELKGGVYNNNISVNSRVVANSVTAAQENLARDRAAFLVEYSAQAIYRMTYSWTLRGGYNLLYVDKVALAPENFNARLTTVTPPGLGAKIVDFGANRFPFINANGHALYHGFNFGAEYMW